MRPPSLKADAVKNFYNGVKEEYGKNHDAVNYWTLGIPDAYSDMVNAKPFSLENWMNSGKFLMAVWPYTKVESTVGSTIERNTAKEVAKETIKTWFQKATKPADYLNEALNRQGLKNAPNSFKEKWSEYGYDFEVRIHPADPNYGKTGSIYRVARRQQGVNTNGQGYGWEYMDEVGNWYKTSILKADSSAAEATHIQLP